jgi:hypothetical protein
MVFCKDFFCLFVKEIILYSLIMDTFSEPSDLLLEVDIISQEEKDKILASIDQDFLRVEDNIRELTEMSSLSSGLRMPVTVGIVAVLITLILLFIADKIIFQEDAIPVTSGLAVFSGSEWEVLKIYIEDTKSKLSTKNIEIDIYKEEIVNYDFKLSSLRELLKVKEETERKLFQERERLAKEGVNEEDINAKVVSLEQSIISELTADMVDLYDISIVELNGQINQILNDRSFSEKNLEESIAERTVLVEENEVIRKEIDSKQEESPVPLEIISAMNKIDEITVLHENDDYIRNQITALYLEIFDNLDNEEYESAADLTSKLQDKIKDSILASSLSSSSQLRMQEKVAGILKEFIDLQRSSLITTVVNQGEIDVRLEDFSVAADIAERTFGLGNIEQAGSQLQTAISEVPEILRVFNLLKEIDKQKNPEPVIVINNNTLVEIVGNNEPEVETVEEIISEESVDINNMLLVGKIGDINFDQITILPVSTIKLQLGTEFYITKQDDQDAELVLGSGVIRGISEEGIMGKLETLFIFSSKPEIDDLIYVKSN